MFCGRCGHSGNEILVDEITQVSGDYVSVAYYGKCEECGELLGYLETFRLVSTDTLDRKTVKLALDRHRIV